jgi:acyl-[acyl carrier protein]--UDP-N-acetylglucosamine O-acyltransferase
MIKQKINDYGIIGSIVLAKNLFLTKLLFNSARIIKFPFDIRGKKYIKLGKDFSCGNGCRIEAYSIEEELEKVVLKIGDNVKMNDYVHLTAIKKVEIGNNVLMASKIYISDCNHGSYKGDKFDSHPHLSPDSRELCGEEVIIGDNVWIGESVCILPGVTIGEGSIIGANSVVTKDIPKYSIAVGNPVKVIKNFNFKLGIWEKVSKE